MALLELAAARRSCAYLLIAGVDECGFAGGWNARTDELMDDSCIDPEADAVDHYTFSSNWKQLCSSLPTDTGKTDECFVMRPRSSVGGAIQMTVAVTVHYVRPTISACPKIAVTFTCNWRVLWRHEMKTERGFIFSKLCVDWWRLVAVYHLALPRLPGEILFAPSSVIKSADMISG